MCLSKTSKIYYLKCFFSKYVWVYKKHSCCDFVKDDWDWLRDSLLNSNCLSKTWICQFYSVVNTSLLSGMCCLYYTKVLPGIADVSHSWCMLLSWINRKTCLTYLQCFTCLSRYFFYYSCWKDKGEGFHQERRGQSSSVFCFRSC